MSNKASHHLFDLIKSLSKSEKRYFKLYSSRHTIGEENGYLRLFDFIDRMDTYQEDLIYMHFKDQPLLNKFSITKARLYNNILKSLNAYYASSSIDAQLFQSLHCADILFNKGLYKQCEKVLRSAEKQAKKNERYVILMEIKQQQRKLVENEFYTDFKSGEIERMLQEEKTLIDEIETHTRLWHVKSMVFREINLRGNVRNEQGAEKLKNLVERIETIDLLLYSDRVNYLYHHIHSAYYFSINDLENSYQHLRANLKLSDDSAIVFKDRPNVYFSVLTNIIYIATQLKKYDEAQAYLIKLKQQEEINKKEKSLDIDMKYFSSTVSLELFLLIEKGEYEKGLDLIPKIAEGYELYGDSISSLRKAYIDFKVGIIYLSLGEYTKALAWMNQILNESKIDHHQDIFCFAQLISLILHVELENKRYLPYAINSTKRYLKNKESVYEFESVFLKAISKMSKAEDIFDLEEKLIPFEKELERLKNDPKEQAVFEYFDFHIWLKSKLSRKSFLEMKRAVA